MSDLFTLRYAAVSDRGLIRSANEDSVYAGPHLVAVADGVGGAVAGEVASELVISALAPLDTDLDGDPVEALRTAVGEANARLRAAIDADPALAGMGTTLTALLLSGDSLTLAHAGDSRAYLLRDGRLMQLTRDDTYVQSLVDEGCISVAEAGVHPQRSLVTRVLQGTPVEATYASRAPVPGDRYLLCSDGLPDAIAVDADAAIVARLRGEPDPARCAERLVELALDCGAPDNVTVVVADVVPAARPAAPHSRANSALLTATLLAAVGVVLWALTGLGDELAARLRSRRERGGR